MNAAYSNHIVFDTFDEVAQIASPLKTLGIKGFMYMRVYKDGSFMDLASDADWTEVFYKRFYANDYDPDEIKDHYFFDNDISLWALNPQNELWREGEQLFNVGNGISVYNHLDDYTEVSFFYADRQNHAINQFYVNNLDLLDRFSIYFKEKASRLITKGEQDKLMTPACYVQHAQTKHEDSDQISIQNFYQDTTFDTVSLSPDTYLTKRELECLHWQSLGKTAEEVAIIMSIAPRTVKAHVRNLKDKLSCLNQFQLGLAYQKLKPILGSDEHTSKKVIYSE
jgi:LuxR family transcriptional regulator, quorum-sensing system regulator SolR